VVRTLLDTCVLSELQRPNANEQVQQSVEAIANRDLFISVITVGEIAKGIALLPASQRRRVLAQWLVGLAQNYGDQILSIDRETARIWGEITARAQQAGTTLPANDGLIAATALQHGLHLMTRNTRRFTASGVMIVDPWEPA